MDVAVEHGQVGTGALASVMTAVINGGIAGHVGNASAGPLRYPKSSRGIIHGHALGAPAGALVPKVGLKDIRTDGHALVLGASGGGLGVNLDGG